MSDFFDKWENESDENKRLVLQEELILNITESLYGLMIEKNLNKSQIAIKLEKSKAYISQLFSGSRNMTLATLADLCFALGMKVESFSFSKLDDAHKEKQVEGRATWFSDEKIIDLQLRRNLTYQSNNDIDVSIGSQCG